MQFTLTSEEGLPLRGNLDIPGDAQALLVAVHGFKGFKDWGFFPWIAELLTGQRVAVCRFNMSRCGIGEDPQTFDRLDLFADDTYAIELADLRTVVRHAQTRADLPTFLFGHSRGGGVVVLGAADVPKLRGVIAWNPVAHAGRWDPETRGEWRRKGYIDVENARTRQMMRISTRLLDEVEGGSIDIKGSAKKLHVPLLVVHGGHDETVPVSEPIELAKAAKDGLRVMIDSATHTFNAAHPMTAVPPQLEMASAVTARFIAGYGE